MEASVLPSCGYYCRGELQLCIEWSLQSRAIIIYLVVLQPPPIDHFRSANELIRINEPMPLCMTFSYLTKSSMCRSGWIYSSSADSPARRLHYTSVRVHSPVQQTTNQTAASRCPILHSSKPYQTESASINKTPNGTTTTTITIKTNLLYSLFYCKKLQPWTTTDGRTYINGDLFVSSPNYRTISSQVSYIYLLLISSSTPSSIYTWEIAKCGRCRR